MQRTLLATKLYRPSPRLNHVSRSRLIKQLADNLSHKLTLVSAPAGFGKTTLLSEWAGQTDLPTAWVSLDDGDNNLGRFLTYIVTSLQSLEQDVGETSLAMLQSSQPPLSEPVLTALVNDITDTQTPMALVLDDYHLVNNPAAHDAVTFMLDHQPPNLYLLLATRVDPPLPLAGLRASGELLEIRAGALRFNYEETAVFLHQSVESELSSDEIAALEARTEGWIAGLQMAALSMQGRTDTRDFIATFTGSHRFVLDYLTEEVLNQQPESVQKFLLYTSILDRLTANLCEAVVGSNHAQEMLEKLERANLFVVPLDHDRLWYRYHHLFADMLQRHLQNTQPDLILELHYRASQWFELEGGCRPNGHHEKPHQQVCVSTAEHCGDAIRHAMIVSDFERAANLIENCARKTFQRGDLATIVQWIERLPKHVVNKRSWLCIYSAWAQRLSGGGFDAVEACLQDAEQALAEQQEIPRNEVQRIMGHIAALRTYQALFREDIPRTLELADLALESLEEENFVHGLTNLALGWARRFSGDLDGSTKALTDSRRSSLAAGNTYGAVAATCRAGYGHVLAGKLHLAMDTFADAVQLATIRGRRRLPVIGYAYVYMGGVYREWSELETAARYLEMGPDLCGQVGYVMDQIVGFTSLARVRLTQGDWSGADDVLQDAKHLSQMMKGYLYAQRWVEDCQLRLWIARGNSAEIEEWINHCGLSVHDEPTYTRELEHLILARALIALGQVHSNENHLADGLTLLAKLQETAETAGWMGKAVEIWTLQAVGYQALGQTEEAIRSLAKAMAWGEPEGYIRVFVDEGQPMVDLLQRAGIQGIHPSYASKLLAAFDDIGDSTISSSLVDPLTDRELEILQFIALGLTNPEIAEELVLSVGTIKSHTGNIYGKLGVRNRTEAVARARELGLL